MKVSVVIKALNEEAFIARAIESSLAALAKADPGGEIILADCLSQDRTVEIGSAYPIRIVQLQNPADRGCGTSPQLGFQYAAGAYVYLMDGDMELHAEFLSAALQAAEADLGLAGVGGIVREMHVENLEFTSRAARPRADLRPGTVDRLDGGGLYRRAAIETVGYLSDRNLHAFEEFELATRLRAKGWRLARLDRIAVDHYGYRNNAYRLLWQRVRSGYAGGAGELARATLGKPSFVDVVLSIRTLWTTAFVIAWLAVILLVLALVDDIGQAATLAAAILVAPAAVMALRRRSLQLGLYAVVVWIAYTVGSLRGFLAARKDPAGWIPSRLLHDRSVSGPGPAFASSSGRSREVA
jgi:glycosyltransferase involved in cell wall biosynthesis